ncbi:hypothetical protein SERLA73DRAFT_141545, partial [Serpula lacrymans var. lacrymans S7.3]
MGGKEEMFVHYVCPLPNFSKLLNHHRTTSPHLECALCALRTSTGGVEPLRIREMKME